MTSQNTCDQFVDSMINMTPQFNPKIIKRIRSPKNKVPRVLFKEWGNVSPKFYPLIRKQMQSYERKGISVICVTSFPVSYETGPLFTGFKRPA